MKGLILKVLTSIYLLMRLLLSNANVILSEAKDIDPQAILWVTV
ncbi:MAG TPA: hypothetical protein VEG39_15910 [Clostridia bacterium]|nr:hypothetical protein [Clostridia bacterium]